MRLLFRLAFGAALSAVFLVSAWLSFVRSVSGHSFLTPSVIGRTAEEASRVARDSGLQFAVERGRERFDARIPAHAVLRQEPGPGALIKAGQTLRVVMSLGPRALSAPDLSGMSERAAAVQLVRNSLTLGEVSTMRVNTGGDAGIVAQSPEKGAPAQDGGRVSVLIDRGRRNDVFVMPDLVGRGAEAETARLTRWGFNVAPPTRQTYVGAPDGTILQQVPPAGYPVSPRDTIRFVVAGASSP